MTRRLSLLAVLALLASACATASGGTTTTAPATTTTAPPQAIPLSYKLAAGDELDYQLALTQHIDLSASGDSSLLGGEDVPGSASVDVSGTATVRQAITDGPDPDTYTVHITGEFSDVSVTGTIDGEPIPTDTVPDFATPQPIDVTVVVDSKGNVIPEDTGSDDLFNGALGGLDSLGTGSVAPGLDPGQFFGPALSDGDVTVGDTWSDEIDTPGMGDDPIVTTLNAQVTGTDQLDGVDVFVIDSTYTTTPIEFDLGDFFSGLFGAFLSDGTSTGDQAQLDDLMSELKFVISADGIESHVVSRFDPAGGLVRAAELTGGSNVGIDIALPDEATGELQSFQMSVKLAQSLSYQLLSGPQA